MNKETSEAAMKRPPRSTGMTTKQTTKIRNSSLNKMTKNLCVARRCRAQCPSCCSMTVYWSQ